MKTGELLKQLRVEHQRIPCIVMQSAARHPFEAQFLCARGAYAVTPKWNHKAIVEEIRQSLRHSDGRSTPHGQRTVLRLRLAIIIAGGRQRERIDRASESSRLDGR